MGNPSTGSYAGKGLSPGSNNKVNIGAPPKGTSHSKAECPVSGGEPPSKTGGQTSGSVKHARSGSGNKVESLKDAPKSNSM